MANSDFLKAWLPFDSSPTEDLFGNTWSAVNSPSIASDNAISGNALQLSSGSYLQSNNKILIGGQDFTIDFWAYANPSQNGAWGYSGILGFGDNTSNDKSGFYLAVLDGNKIRLSFNNTNSTSVIGSDTINVDARGALKHYEIDYLHSQRQVLTFVDGVLASTINLSADYARLERYVYIGRTAWGASQYFNGTIDEFRIFDGVALHTQNFTPPSSLDYFNLNLQLGLDFDSERKIHKSIDCQFDTLRKFVWRYENFGTADLLTVNGYTVALDDAVFKQAFYQTERVKCFDIPASDELWIKFDVFSDGTTWRAYNDTGNGFVDGITCYVTYRVLFWSSAYKNSDVYESGSVFVQDTLQSILLHMVSGANNGIIEAWIDGVFVHKYIGNVNNGNDFQNFYLQSDGVESTFSNVIISNSQIALTDNASMPLDIDFDTKRILFAPVDFSLDFDTKLQIFQSVNFNADSLRQVVKSVDDTFDTHRFVVRTVNFDVDTLRKIPFKFFVTPATNQFVFDSTISAGLQYLEISLSAGQLVDQLSFSTTNPIDMLQQVQGQILDYKFNFRVEDLDQRGISNSCKCCSDIDELLYTQIAYTLSKTNWNGGTYAVDSKKSTVTSTTFIMLDKPHANAAAHAISIAKKLTLDTVCLFDDFTSTVDVKQEGVTYQDLISEIFNWSLRVPHKLINLFIRDHTLYIIQRGHEQNTITLNNSDFAQDFVIHKSLIRTSFGVTRSSQSVERSNGSNNKKGHYEPILGSPLPEEYQDPPDDDETPPPPEPTEPARNLPDHVTTVENGITTDINYDYDKDGNLIKTTTTTIGGDVDTLVIVTNHYSNINGEKLLDKETTDEYEAEYRDATNPAGESFTQRVWNWVDGKVIYHTYTTVGQQHISSVSSDGSVNGSVTATARHNDKPTPFDRKQSSKSALDNYAENHNYQPNSIYTYQNGVKVEVVGYQWVDDSAETNNTITGTLETVKLYDSSFPVDDNKAKQITEDLKWLNRKIQEIVSGTIYNFKHIFDFNDKFVLNGNIYFLQSNFFVMTDNFTNKQFIQLVRWY